MNNQLHQYYSINVKIILYGWLNMIMIIKSMYIFSYVHLLPMIMDLLLMIGIIWNNSLVRVSKWKCRWKVKLLVNLPIIRLHKNRLKRLLVNSREEKPKEWRNKQVRSPKIGILQLRSYTNNKMRITINKKKI